MSPPKTCPVCRVRPVALRGAPSCFGCWPGGAHPPPRCWRCGGGPYFADGQCEHCHYYGPQHPVSCTDCLAWGLLRTTGGYCQGCRRWRAAHPGAAPCAYCARVTPLAADGACRLCHRQGTLQRPVNAHLDLAAANRHGQQLFLADLFHRHGSRTAYRPGTPQAPYTPAPPVRHTQLLLIDPPRDLRIGRKLGFSPPPDPDLEAHLIAIADAHAARYGWGRNTITTVRRGLRILLGVQDTPGARIKATHIAQLRAIRLPVISVREILAEADLLDDDREPPVVTFYRRATRTLPEPIRDELDVWCQIMLNGSRTAPRRRARDPKSLLCHLRWVLPALQVWADQGHHTLRAISLDHVLAVLPEQPRARTARLTGIRSVFKILKARRLVFIDPTAGLPLRAPPASLPTPADTAALRDALNSTNPTRALVAALLAFHALTPRQLPTITLTDLRDGRLHLDGRVIPLAAPVQQRLDDYLAYRQRRWPRTGNTHLFLNHYNCTRTEPTAKYWINRTLGLPAQAVREDRILHEALATGGDTRRLCDLFGLSFHGATRYTNAVDHPGHHDPGAQPPANVPGS